MVKEGNGTGRVVEMIRDITFTIIKGYISRLAETTAPTEPHRAKGSAFIRVAGRETTSNRPAKALYQTHLSCEGRGRQYNESHRQHGKISDIYHAHDAFQFERK